MPKRWPLRFRISRKPRQEPDADSNSPPPAVFVQSVVSRDWLLIRCRARSLQRDVLKKLQGNRAAVPFRHVRYNKLVDHGHRVSETDHLTNYQQRWRGQLRRSMQLRYARAMGSLVFGSGSRNHGAWGFFRKSSRCEFPRNVRIVL